MKKILFQLLFLLSAFSSPGQYTEYPFLIFSVFPGLGSNGLDPANSFSDFSINLISGYQRGTYILELSGINSINIERTYGIQVSGLANMTGINLYQGIKPRDIRKEIARGHYAELNGIQVSGLLNYVRGDGTGVQLSGGINISQDMMMGVQAAGLFNFSRILLTGAQVSMLGNISQGSTLGVQVGSLFNYTQDQLNGFQIGAINRAETIEGKNSISGDHSTAFQVGIFNKARTMNGFQIGLVNMGGNCRGVQVGLVNFYSTRYKNGKLNGTPVAPLNLGSNSSLRCFYDETFNLNIALGTGNSKNGNIYERRKTLYIMNQLMYRKSDLGKSPYHAFGWAFEHQVYNRDPDPMSPMNHFYFISLGGGVSNVFFKNEDPGINLLSELDIIFGSRISPKVPGIYFFGFAGLNYYHSNNGLSVAPEKPVKDFNPGSQVNMRQIWPGYGFGIQFIEL